MWNSLTEEDRSRIKELQDYFVSIFPEVEPKVVRDRIHDGYCWGEGCFCQIVTVEDWNTIFNSSGLQKALLTCFNNWDEYIKYDGDFHKKLNAVKEEKAQ